MNEKELDTFARYMVESGQAERYIRDWAIGYAVLVGMFAVYLVALPVLIWWRS